MKLRCPSCHAENSLEAYLGADAARLCIAMALKMPAPMGNLIVQYLTMFRSKGRSLAFERVEKLLQELLPMITNGQVSRGGIDRAAPQAAWEAGIRQMLDARDAGKLTLPLKSHGYLLEIVAGMAERAAQAVEDRRETSLRAGHREQPSTPSPAKGPSLTERIQMIGSQLRLQMIDEDKARAQLEALNVPEAAIKELIELNRIDP